MVALSMGPMKLLETYMLEPSMVNLLEREIHSQRVAQISISTIGPSQVEQSKGQLFRSPLSMPLQVKTLRLHWH